MLRKVFYFFGFQARAGMLDTGRQLGAVRVPAPMPC